MSTAPIDDLRTRATAEFDAASDAAALTALATKYLGRNGEVAALMDQLRTLPAEEKRAFGAAVNALKTELTDRVDARKAALSAASGPVESLDLTLPGRPFEMGYSHPVRAMTDYICDIFQAMGFAIADGPDVDTEFYNFDALNLPEDHPAREESDTFYVDRPRDGKFRWLLRTHTSTVQIRTMRSQPPPIRIIAPGRCYRRDAVDSTHFPTFHQVEGLYIDHYVSMGDLKGTLLAFAEAFLGGATDIRLRPSFFPFTEPSVEVDARCVVCQGAGTVGEATCRTCRGAGWIELGGAGMVHPNVLVACNIDPEDCCGFAFGLGIERFTMMRHAVEDIRAFYDNDLRFLKQF